VVGVFPNDASVERLVTAVVLETHDEWAVSDRRYLSETSMAQLSTATANSPQAVIGIPQGWTPQFPRDGHEKSPRTAMVSPHGRPRELPAGSLTANR
jgi:hypothetical protein